ncbi:eCIS core domain-containing protein [Kribbella sp. NPDC055110]
MSHSASNADQHMMLQSLRDESHQLDAGVRTSMERSMRAPFGDVVIHTGPASAELADTLDAAAFTIGRHVVFGAGKYDPDTLRGRMLLAHELAHVVQQGRGSGNPELGDRLPTESLPLETSGAESAAATSAARAALGATAPVPGPTGVMVARQTRKDEELALRPVDKLLRDPVSAARLDRIVKAGGDVRGEIVEELGQAEIRAALQSPEGRAKLLGEQHRDSTPMFYEGRRVRAVDGSKLTDGIVLVGTGDTREAVLIAEYKQSKENELAERAERRPHERNKAEARAYAKEHGTTAPRKEAGQFASVRERIRDDRRIQVFEDGAWTTVRIRVTDDTVYLGGSPNAKALDRALAFYGEGGRGEWLKMRTAAQRVDVTKQELAEAEEKLASKAGVAPPSQVQAQRNRQAKAKKRAAIPPATAPVGIGRREPADASRSTSSPPDILSAGNKETPETEPFSEFPKQVVVPDKPSSRVKPKPKPKQNRDTALRSGKPSASVPPAPPEQLKPPPLDKPPTPERTRIESPTPPLPQPHERTGDSEALRGSSETPMRATGSSTTRRRDTATPKRQPATQTARSERDTGGASRSGTRPTREPASRNRPRGGAEVMEWIADNIDRILERLNEAGIDLRIRNEISARMPAIEAYQSNHQDDGVLLIARISEPDPEDPRSLSQPNLRSFVTVIERRGGRTQDDALAQYESSDSLELGYLPGHRGSERRLIWIQPRRHIRPDDWIGGAWTSPGAPYAIDVEFGPTGQLFLRARETAHRTALSVTGLAWHVGSDNAQRLNAEHPLSISFEAALAHPDTGSTIRSRFRVIDSATIEETVIATPDPHVATPPSRIWRKTKP